MDLAALPTVNAALNAASAVLLSAGYWLIRRGERKRHAVCMGAACVTSIMFLISYLYYHAHHGATRFTAEGWIRPVYFTILISHTILAAAAAPLVIMTLTQALRGRFDRHARTARLTLPVWLYVSVTGVVIYWMLYRAVWP